MNRSSSEPGTGGGSKTWWVLLALSLIIFLPFAGNGFLADDWDVLSHLVAGGPFGMWTHPPTSFFRPMVSSTLWLNSWAGPWHSWAYSIPSFVLNALNAGLVFLVSQALLRRNPEIEARTKRAISALAALIFLTAPSNVEAILFISARGDLLAGFFVLASVLAFMAAVDRRRIPLTFASVGLLALGCFSKESTYAFFLFFAAVAFFERKDAGRAKIGWIASGLGFLAVSATAALRSRVVSSELPYGTQSHLPVEAAKGVVRLAIMSVRPAFPVDFGILLGHSVPKLTALDWVIMIPVLVCAGTGTWCLARCTKGPTQRPSSAVPVAGFLVSGIAVCFLAIQPFSPENGRLMYLPSAFAAIALSFSAAPYLCRPAVRTAAVAFVACGALFIYLNGVLYRSAGDSCAASIRWFATNRPSPSPAVILVPDSVGGRYIWRNGFPQALGAFAPSWAASPYASTAYFLPAQVGRALNSPVVDVSAMKTGAFQRSRQMPSGKTIRGVELVVVGIDGAVTVRNCADVVLPDLVPCARDGHVQISGLNGAECIGSNVATIPRSSR
ncbi:MAG TPA: hypothetical protein VMI31_08930 [Fimbriimonadaceae bacterium]|nr:hypothetical protein [Fimbriimonadaceae bacterium]